MRMTISSHGHNPFINFNFEIENQLTFVNGDSCVQNWSDAAEWAQSEADELAKLIKIRFLYGFSM